MTDERPEWMVEDTDGCLVDVDLDPADHVADEDVADLVLTAGVDQTDEAAKARRRDEYAALFPDAASKAAR